MTICLGDGLGMLVTDVGDRFTWSISSPLIEAIDCVSKREIVLKIFLWPWNEISRIYILTTRSSKTGQWSNVEDREVYINDDNNDDSNY